MLNPFEDCATETTALLLVEIICYRLVLERLGTRVMEYTMLQQIRCLLLGAVIPAVVGCSTTSLTYTPGVGWSWGLPQTKPDTVVDQAWRSGGGFNNPNPERIREGKPPLNFDGSVYKP